MDWESCQVDKTCTLLLITTSMLLWLPGISGIEPSSKMPTSKYKKAECAKTVNAKVGHQK